MRSLKSSSNACGLQPDSFLEWDEEKNKENQSKHNVSFAVAQQAFLDLQRVVAEDVDHSKEEDRFFCIGRVGDGIMTVRFTKREDAIRIYGAGYWRKGRKLYEEQNSVY
ncbi:MAG: BrnT family toxin [Nitrospirae bacterium]|nr:BrnT family toxin [Candidatus Troglogloeales bacterium]MBI3598308.1 BrnT family toxin [Candidatus Troglogloeales bacterium]